MFSIKTFNGTPAHDLAFYILNKGNNAGKPSYQPFRNSYMVTCPDHATLTTLFWACKALYLNRQFRIHIHGTAIPTIRLNPVKQLLSEAYTRSLSTGLPLLTAVKQVNDLDSLLKVSKGKIDLISQLQSIILYNYFIKQQ